MGHAYEHIAEELRGAILTGTYRPGDRLPRHEDLAARFEVSAIVIRQAIGRLKAQGLVETAGRGGTVVRDRPTVRRITMGRYLADAGRQHPDRPRTSFTHDARITWSQYRLDKAFRWISADERLAGLFGVRVGERALERRFVFYADGVPGQMSRSCLLAADVEGTPVADPHNEPWPGGNIGQLRTLGIHIDRITEETGTRMPTPEEASTLGIGTGVPVFVITRLMYSGDRVVEVADPIVIPGDRAVRFDELRLDR
ncbi:GntR family transcriptional regulator [Spongiactinospora sp. 9N601]|uniref:GntR family transcriptional regulator n=1 Tax=Spongiactinospora sp. 9N601 TaxID=3375149 RepID=UPI003789B426